MYAELGLIRILKIKFRQMRYRYLSILILFLALGIASCQSDFIDGVNVKDTPKENGSVVTMVTQSADGIISLSVDAPALDRFGVWIDLNGDGKRAEDGSENVRNFNVYQEYQLPAGVKSFAVYGDITYLGAASNNLIDIDVSGNPYLSTLNVPMNELKSIDVSANESLKRLDVSANNISSIDVSSNRMLESLWVYNNEVKSLDVSSNTNLAFLDCSGNALSFLDLSNNLGLMHLLAYNNQLNSIDVSRNTKLNRMWLYGNSFSDTEIERLSSLSNEVFFQDLWITD